MTAEYATTSAPITAESTPAASTATPTPNQRQAIRFFAGQLDIGKIRNAQTTYKVCRREGWIEEIDTHPYHRATAAGRAAIGLQTDAEPVAVPSEPTPATDMDQATTNTEYELVQTEAPYTVFRQRPGAGIRPRRVVITQHEIRDTDGTVLASIETENGDHRVCAGRAIDTYDGFRTRDWEAAVREAHATATQRAPINTNCRRTAETTGQVEPVTRAHAGGNHELPIGAMRSPEVSGRWVGAEVAGETGPLLEQAHADAIREDAARQAGPAGEPASGEDDDAECEMCGRPDPFNLHLLGCPPVLFITRGLPGSGKTTFARNWVAADRAKRHRVNRDDVRTMLHGGRLGTIAQENAVTTVCHTAISALLDQDQDVICDDTNLEPEHVQALTDLAHAAGARVEIIDLTDQSLEECLARNEHRPPAQRVPAEVIAQMHTTWIAGRGYPLPMPDSIPIQ